MISSPINGRSLPRRRPAAVGLGVTGSILSAIVLAAIIGPAFVGDPAAINPIARLRWISSEHPLGTDFLGRDVLSRAAYGAQRSLTIGLVVGGLVSAVGVVIGILLGYFEALDRWISPIMDGVMAIPGILLAIAFVSVLGPGTATVVLAISLPEIPRMVRVIRAAAKTAKEKLYVVAARSLGTPMPLILWRHVLPSTIGPLAVQASYTCAAAILAEAILTFIGVGGSGSPSWGGMIAESRQYFQLAPWLIAFPSLMLSVLIVLVNAMGDTLRELVDPRLARSGL